MSKSLGIIKVRLGPGIVSCELLKENVRTVLVRLKNGKIIKRHKEKHVVNDSPVGETTEAR